MLEQVLEYEQNVEFGGFNNTGYPDVHRAADIPLNEVYTKWNHCYKRCGCLPCTAYLGWKRKLSRSHPALYRWLLSFEKHKESCIQ